MNADFLKIKSTFKQDLFGEHLEILDMWHRLKEFNKDEINHLPPDWKEIYEYIIPYEKVYQNLKQADIQNRVLAPEYKTEVCASYEAIIKEMHEKFYPYLLEQLRSPENLVSDALRELKSGTKNGILLVFDGMRFDFWKLLKEQIEKARLPIEIEEDIRYAIIPTLTEVSRHSIFANGIAYNIREEQEFEGTYIFSEADFYEKYNSHDRLTGIVSHFIDNRIHISNSVKGEFVEFRGIQEDFRRYVDSVIIPMLRHILSSRTVQVIITSDHGFINLDKKNRILDHVYEETIKDSIKRLNSDWDFDTYSDMFLVSPSKEVTTEITNRFSKDIIIIRNTEYERYHVPKELSGDAIIFPKVYRHLWDASLKYNHGSLSIFETMVPFIRLTYKYE